MRRNSLAARNTRTLILGVMLVLVSAGMIYMHFTRQKITTASDLKIVRGPFLGCFSGSRNDYCDISLEADYNTYHIPAAFLRCFDKDSFLSKVHTDDPLALLVNRKLIVFSVADKSEGFLNADSAIAIYNGPFDIWKGTFLFLVGGVFVIRGVVANRNRT
jgi:hypothetical protein